LSISASEIRSKPDLEQLEETIIVLEAQRAHLGDAVVDTAIAPLREKLAALQVGPAASGQQRKFVTILFADMTGWTALSQRLELEDMMALTDGAIRRFNRIIERRGGRVLKFMGDGLMAVFGLPQVQEDDAERAVQAGLDILGSAKIYAQVLEERWNLSGFNVRIGINTGPIIMGGGLEEERTAIGMTVNLASRMESTAPECGLRITDATYQQVQGMFEVDPQPLLQIKGRDRPLLTYLVKAVRPRTFRMGRHGIKGIKTPLIGRQAEFEQLLALCERTVKSKTANIITVVGEPGIGKSRLILEFEKWLSPQPALAHTFHARGFRPLQDSPYGVLRMLIAHYCQIQDSDELDVVYHKLESRLTGFFGEDGLMKSHFIGALMGYNLDGSPYLLGVLDEPKQLRDRALHYLTQLFCKVSSDGLTVILVEDIHWADSSSLEFLQKLTESCADQPLLIISLARPELTLRHPQWLDAPKMREEQVSRLNLTPLNEQASHQLVREILKNAESIPDALAETIVNQADGNPLYIEELVKVLIDDGVIVRLADGDVWRIDMSKLEDSGVPETLTAVMLSRMGSLPQVERNALKNASVAGRSFWGSLVNAVSGRTFSQEDVLASLVTRDLIYQKEDSTFAGETEYAFKHALLREAIYETILMGNREKYHGRVANWLRSTTEVSGREDEFALVIAEHYDLAKMPDPAADFYLQAGEKARDQGVPAEALKSLECALDLMGDERSTRQWRAMLAKASVLGWLGKLDEQLISSQSLVKQAHHIGDEDQLAEAYYRLGFAAHSLGRLHDEAQAYETALIAARRAGNLEIEARSTALLALCLLRLGNLDQAARVAQDGLDLTAGVEDDVIRAQALTNIASYYSGAGDVAKATQLFGEVVDICSRVDMQFGEAVNRINLGYNYILLGLSELASNILEEASRLTFAIGAHHNHAYCQLNLGLAYFRLGDLKKAQAILEQALAEMESFGDQFGQASGNLYLALSLEQDGALLAASGRFNHARSIFEEVRTPGYAIDASAGLARYFLANNDLDSAYELASQVWDYLSENGSQAMEFSGLAFLTCAQIYEAMGKQEQNKAAVTAGYADMMERAEKIEDEAWRRSFLQNVTEHQALIERQQTLAKFQSTSFKLASPPGG